MARPDRFRSHHAHGFVRVAAATPLGTVGDPGTNADRTIALAERGHEAAVDLIVYPELNVTSYAIDDLHMQDAIIGATDAALAAIAAASAKLDPLLLVGAAVQRNQRLYNCAVAIHRGRILGVVPKVFLPNYREYYEKRWFASGFGQTGGTIRVGGQDAPFGTDLLFAADDLPDFVVHAETCEDYWSATPPSVQGALAGALICCNLSASNVVIGKARQREMLTSAHSARLKCAYIFSATGTGESTTDLAWDGQGTVHEAGELIAASARFDAAEELLIVDVDAGRMRQERLRDGTWNDAVALAGHPATRFRRIAFDHRPDFADRGFRRELRRFPFVPNTPERLDEDCFEAFNIQVQGIARRMQAAGAAKLVIGVSGGLDSSHALIVCAKAMDLLGRPRTDILGFTMPGFATGEGTKGNAWALMRALGVTAEEIDIRPAANRMLADLGHPYADGEPVYDVTFENVQAGLRTDYLFRLANQRGGLVVGTGDLSELALGWCTYGVGDQMSHYGVNAGVPKTLIQFLIRWATRTDQFDADTDRVLEAILAQEISPELVPGERLQSTEERIGPYPLHDFFLHHVVRYGLAPSKVAFLAWQAWRDADAGRWPLGVPDGERRPYDLPMIVSWLEVFLHRFFTTSQFKRSAMPNGPKVSGGGALSPRGDWRAPSDGTARAWLDELKANGPA